jgi:uncharacterized protein YndB with AHSA1/START domain
MPDIVHRIGIKKAPEQVQQALVTLPGLAGWWTDDVTGDPRAGGTLDFTFKTPGGDVVGAMKMTVEAIEPGTSVRWKVIDGPPDWIGTGITFDTSVQDGQTILIFGHRRWAESTESMAHCSMKWAVFLLSLRDLVETGKGRPSPGDLKIDNWN